ncbi:MAG TPA: hypothetical protein VGE98_11920, partial [Thermoanaerobaculia bacterium]
MKRQIALVTLFLGFGLFARGAWADGGNAATRPVRGSAVLADDVVYWHLFRHVVALAKHAD